jgi:hypothetical protein
MGRPKVLKPCWKNVLFVTGILLGTSLCRAAQPEAGSPPRVAAGIKLSLLGIGGEAAVPITSSMDVRAGFNGFGYSRDFDKDGVTYAAHLSFRSLEAHYDWFPFAGGFHLSPGLLVYNGNQVTADASVPGGQSFDLDNSTYSSDPSNPVRGKAKIDFKKVAPTFTVGWGNLLRRSSRHWSIPFEIGFAYQDAPRATLSLTGGACDSSGVNCRDINSDPTVLANLQAEQDKLNKDISPFKFYPLISIGFGYKF